MASKSISNNDFLNAHKIHDKVFVTGMFYSGITIYNQQVRTLNLIYFLRQNAILESADKIDQSRRIVIIGGGISGLTAAIAFKRLGFNVSILEEKSILLHLQHGCSTRQIHPNLFLWPRTDSLKPFTELPFANWKASDAAGIEKVLIKQFESEKRKKGGTLTDYYNIKDTSVDLKTNSVSFKNGDGSTETINYSFLLLATGFGLEKFVGRKEKTKSYWRNEDLAQLRLRDQIKKFLISGTGDGGVSDVCRLVLIAFDPLEWAKTFEKIEIRGRKLINELRKIEKESRAISKYNYSKEFNRLYNDFSRPINWALRLFKRSDIDKLILNGKKKLFEENLVKGNMSFINAWILFVLKKQNLFEYYSGGFPNECGDYIFANEIEDEFHVIVRHGTDKNMDHFKALHKNFEGKSQELSKMQKQKRYNDFSTLCHWELQFWTSTPENEYSAKKYIVANELTSITSVFLTTLEGIINCFIAEKFNRNINFRMTLHRLVCYSNKYLFQQIGPYVGTRKAGEIGRAFPIQQGVVGLAMRSNFCYSLIKKEMISDELFDYEKIFARTLGKNIDSFLLVPIATLNKKASVLCLYFDTTEEQLVKSEEFRKLIYWSLTSYLKKIDNLNVEQNEITRSFIKPDIRKQDIATLEKTRGIYVHNSETKPYIDKDMLIMSSNRLIDIYAE